MLGGLRDRFLQIDDQLVGVAVAESPIGSVFAKKPTLVIFHEMVVVWQAKLVNFGQVLRKVHDECPGNT